MPYLNVFLGIFQILKERIIAPDDTGLLVGGRIRIAVGLSGLTTKEAVQIGSLLVRPTGFNSMALRAFGLEDLGALGFTHGTLIQRRESSNR